MRLAVVPALSRSPRDWRLLTTPSVEELKTKVRFRAQSNGGYCADSGPSGGDTCRRTFRPFETFPGTARCDRPRPQAEVAVLAVKVGLAPESGLRPKWGRRAIAGRRASGIIIEKDGAALISQPLQRFRITKGSAVMPNCA